VNRLADLEEFIHDHHPHGTMTGEATEPAWNSNLITVACPCGVVFERWVTPEAPRRTEDYQQLNKRPSSWLRLPCRCVQRLRG